MMGKYSVARFLLAGCMGVLGTSVAHADHIINSDTGGDCATFGTWDSATATCTLTRDLNEPVILIGNLTLDGNGHSISGPGDAGVTCDSSFGGCGLVTIENLTVTGFQVGISFSYAAGAIHNSIVSGNAVGISMTRAEKSCPHTITHNIIKDNGLALRQNRTECGVVANNLFADNQALFEFTDIKSMTLYNNNFIDNGPSEPAFTGFVGRFNLPSPTGGNYWSEFHLPAQGCDDVNRDGFCDAPFPGVFVSTSCPGCERDNLPWTQPNGWFVLDIANLMAAKDRACDLSWISKQGVCNGLGAKLQAAKASIERGRFDTAANQLGAFLNQLRAQNGKAVTQQAYVLLAPAAQSLIGQLQP